MYLWLDQTNKRRLQKWLKRRERRNRGRWMTRVGIEESEEEKQLWNG